MRLRKDAYLKHVHKLSQPVSSLKGIGPKRALWFNQKGIRTVLDLFFFTPIRYEDRTRISPITEAEDGDQVVVRGKVIQGGEDRFYPSRKRLFKIRIRDKEGILELIWFQYRKPHLTLFAVPGKDLIAYGRVRRDRGRKQMVHPEVRMVAAPGDSTDYRLGIYPTYSVIRGISTSAVRSTIRGALETYLPSLVDPVPGVITADLGFPDLPTAIRHVHFPPIGSSVDHLNEFDTPYHRRLTFDRFFVVMLIITYLKRCRDRRSGPIWRIWPGLWEDLDLWLPFKLTTHQVRAVNDMIHDFTCGKAMNRLLIGDVGCGKTVVAAVAAHISVRNGHQVALMVPTQVLASQHLEYFSSLSDTMGFRPVLLTSRLKKAEREDIHEGIRHGVTNLVIGTQSLIQEGVSFSRLGLIIIDEQQRFGVRERALMDRKGENPHLLVMTATPIPRTLAITVYGDMDISVIAEYPMKRTPVATQLVTEEEKRGVFQALKRRLSQGQQAFVICPAIEASEDEHLKDAVEMAGKLKKILTPPFRIGLIHGRLSAEEKDAVMDDFRKGLIDLLVGTTVVEVGVHVPKATLMVIEHPERFGLSQLHQLRGRIGRGLEPGLCFLMASKNLSEKAVSRLKTLVENHDGFEIAQKDLEQRGHGEFIGMRQAGVGELDLSEMIRESELLSKAKEAAQRVIDDDPGLSKPEHGPLRVFVESVLARPLDL
jgi:ATP-dependent DNA helicase RecG